MDDFIGLLPVAALLCIGAIGLGRVATLYRRGVRVIVVDPQRTAAEQAFDLVVVLAAALWTYLVFDFAWPPGPPWLPGALQRAWRFGAPVRLLGALLLAAGVVVYATAVWHMGASWRMGIDRTPNGGGAPADGLRLITAGIYRWSRNPIYVAFDLTLWGTFAVQGLAALLLLAVLLMSLLHVQTIREERFLARRFGSDFDAYQRRVGRYLSWR